MNTIATVDRQIRETTEVAAGRALELRHPVLATVAAPGTEQDPLSLLGGSDSGWWAGGASAMSGSGVAAEVVADGPSRLTDLSSRVRGMSDGWAGDEGFAFVGMGFTEGPYSGGWEPFPGAVARVPEIAIVERDGARSLVATVAVHPGGADEAVERLSSLLAATHESDGASEVRASVTGDFTPDDERFLTSVEEALQRIGRGDLTKVVLARRLRARSNASARAVAAALRARYPEAYCYAQIRGGSAFVGASPELLVETDGETVRAAPTAGTVAGTGDSSQDRKLAGGLDTIKSRWEQELVADAVYEALEPLCESIHASLPMVVPAGPVQHLVTTIEGRLARAVPVLDLIATIHPTPAVAGLPRDDAIDVISRAEGFERGWYAGAVGVIDARGYGSLAAALRGALLHEGLVDLFAGAGIVEGSIPDEERLEIELKLRAVASVFSPGS